VTWSGVLARNSSLFLYTSRYLHLTKNFELELKKGFFEGVKKRYFNINIEKKSLFSKTINARVMIEVSLERGTIGNKTIL
jgi:hypothetical protein